MASFAAAWISPPCNSISPAPARAAVLARGKKGAGGPAAAQTSPDGRRLSVEDAAREIQKNAKGVDKGRLDRLALEMNRAEKELRDLDAAATTGEAKEQLAQAKVDYAKLKDSYETQRQAALNSRAGAIRANQEGTLGVNLSVSNERLRNQMQTSQTATRWLGSRNALEVGGIWIDETYTANHKTVAVKAMSNAYFRILDRHPDVRKVFSIGNHLVWVSPSQVALVLDPAAGAEEMADADIDNLFVATPPMNK